MNARFHIMLLLLLFGTMVYSQTFTPGNIVVVRVGDGAAPLSSLTSPVFLDEYTTTGNLVQSISLPTALNGANKRLTISGNDFTLGVLALSLDKRYLTLGGLDVAPSTPLSIALQPSVLRVIGRIDYNGSVNTSTTLSDVGSGVPSSAVSSNGINIWTCISGGSAGLRHINFGPSTTSTQIVAGTNTRVANLYGGNLFNGGGTGAIFRVGNSILPTTGPQIQTTLISNANGGFSQNGHFLADLDPLVSGYDVMYLTGKNGTLQKYYLNGSVWIQSGTIGTINETYGNITGVVNGTTVSLYITRKIEDPMTVGQPSELVTLVDNTGRTGSITGLIPVLLRTSIVNTGFRGVAMAPIKCKVPSLRIGATNPTSGQIFVTDSIEAAAPYEYVISTIAAPPASGTSVGSHIISLNSLNPGTHYFVHVRRNCGGGDFSAWATIDFTTNWPPCTSPVNFSQSLSGNNTAFTWDQVFTAVKYEYTVSSTSIPSASNQFVSGPTVSLPGLQSAKQYYLHVRAYCGSGDTSAWSSKLFTTSCFTPIPYLIKNNWQDGTAEIGWHGEFRDQVFEYSILNNQAPIGGSIRLIYDTMVSIKNLIPGGKYYFSVRQRCNGGAISEWGKLEFNVSGAHVYPSPANEQITIRVFGQETIGKMVQIYDANGKRMIAVPLTGNTAVVKIKAWARGIYFVRFENDHKYVTKFIKQ